MMYVGQRSKHHVTVTVIAGLRFLMIQRATTDSAYCATR